MAAWVSYLGEKRGGMREIRFLYVVIGVFGYIFWVLAQGEGDGEEGGSFFRRRRPFYSFVDD